MRVDFWTSDLHLNHRNILKWRGFEGSLDEMNAVIRDRWNAVVGPHDIVGIVGDIVMGPRIEGLPLIAGLNGRKLHWPGNHDHNWIGYDRRVTAANNWPELYGEYVEAMTDGTYNVDGFYKPVTISHFPYYGDHTDEERHTEYRPGDDGYWLLHGHVHNLWAVNGRMVNVGIDAWGEPISTEAIESIMQQGPQFVPTPERPLGRTQ